MKNKPDWLLWEENEYKSTYSEPASVRCVFEKALTNNQLKCTLANHFCLADREGYSCTSEESSKNCDKLLQRLRKKSAFVLKGTSVYAQFIQFSCG